MKTLIKNGRVVDPANGIDDTLDILIEDGKITKIGRDIPKAGADVVQAAGKIVAPGFIDMHTHLREPGREEAETIKTGTEAAAAGGFTAVACMPNTNPVNDNESVTQFIIKKAAAEGSVHVYPVGAITKGSKGESLSEIGELHRAGCAAISDDGKDVMDNLLMRRAMEYASMFDMPVIDHCEAADLSGEGVMNEGAVSTALGMKPIPAAAEEIMVQRNILLARDTGCRIHIAHISTEESVEMVRRAKKRGIKVTCEATPHHFTLTDDECRSYDTNYKMKPPLRSDKDRKAITRM
jgi:dihydroorotase